MPDEGLPKKVLNGELQVGKRSQGGQKKRYKDTLKASLKDFDIPTVPSNPKREIYKITFSIDLYIKRTYGQPRT